jgi:hypothetical protein
MGLGVNQAGATADPPDGAAEQARGALLGG